jgi:hypothetical protein
VINLQLEHRLHFRHLKARAQLKKWFPASNSKLVNLNLNSSKRIVNLERILSITMRKILMRSRLVALEVQHQQIATSTCSTSSAIWTLQELLNNKLLNQLKHNQIIQLEPKLLMTSSHSIVYLFKLQNLHLLWQLHLIHSSISTHHLSTLQQALI